MVPPVLLVVGVSQLIVGVWAFVAPGSFYDTIATFPPQNDHFLKDIGSWNVGLGLAAVIASRTPSWQRGMLAVLTVQFALHAVSHAIDVGVAEPESQGVSTLVLQIAGTLVLGGLLARESMRPDPTPGRARGVTAP
jgi:predicted anti-sigma-YlaC factor YlaD